MICNQFHITRKEKKNLKVKLKAQAIPVSPNVGFQIIDSHTTGIETAKTTKLAGVLGGLIYPDIAFSSEIKGIKKKNFADFNRHKRHI